MARPPREAACPSALGPALLRYAAARGVDASLLATRSGLEPQDVDVDKDEVPITATELATMLNVSAELVGDPHLALRLPTELVFRKFDAGALAARAAATPRGALEAIARYAVLVFPRLDARVVAAAVAGEKQEKQEIQEIEFHARIQNSPRGLGHHVNEYVLAFALAQCRRTEAPIIPRRAWIESARPSGDLGALVRALGTDEIEFGSEDSGFALSIEDASRALPSFDPMLVAAAEQIASAALASAPRANALAVTVANKIEATLPADVSADSIALAMKMSARTLQRRLDDEGGIRFSTLLDEVRERMAKRLLRDDSLTLAEIGYRLGFSDLATFSRAFKRWTGMPPGSFRRRDSS